MRGPAFDQTTPLRPEFQPGFWFVPAVIVSVSGLLALFGEAGRLALRFDRQGLGDGELWRLATGHLVHLNAQHLALNAFGVLLVWLLVGDSLSRGRWFVVLFLIIVLMDAAFWWLSPGLDWYLGLSGALHGMLFAGLIAGWRGRPVESLVVGAVVAAKLSFEQLSGPLPGSESAAGGPVVVDAHLYGAVAGIMAALPIVIRGRANTAL